ncbi:adenylate/guanylate cyclase domain-containing protein [Deltaproteobacteria bacterium TL4]
MTIRTLKLSCFFSKVIGVVLIYSWMGTTMLYAQNYVSQLTTPTQVTSGWQYRWGVSPLNEEGRAQWLFEKLDDPHWKSFQLPIQIARDRIIPQFEKKAFIENLVAASIEAFENYTTLWIRVPLPREDWKDASLYIAGALETHQLDAYLDQTLIWNCKQKECEHAGEFSHIHLFPLPENAYGKMLTLRFKLKAFPPPAFRYVTLSSRANNLLKVIADNFDQFLLGSLLILIGSLQISIILRRGEYKSHASLGFCILCAGFWIFFSSDISKFYYYDAVLWENILLISFLLAPVGLCIFFEQMFGPGPYWVVRFFWISNLVFALCAISIVRLEYLDAEWIMAFFKLLLIPGTLIVLALAIKDALNGNLNANMFTLGMTVLFLTMIRDILVDFRILPGYWNSYTHWGMAFFLGTLGFVIERHFSVIHKRLEVINQASSRFVPHQFLTILEKESIVEIQLGDCVQKEMTILFSDIRSFTTISEQMTPNENFRFINSYLGVMGPIIRKHQGFIDKYIGDAIMALFMYDPDDAVKAAIHMLQELPEFNETRKRPGRVPIEIGIGINTGALMIGTIGEQNRMEGTVISDAVNLAARMEGMTKHYGASLLISDHTFFKLKNPSDFSMRMIDQVKVKGKSEPVSVWEVLDGEKPKFKDAKMATEKIFSNAVSHYHQQQIQESHALFQECLAHNPNDKAALIYLERCQHYLDHESKSDWHSVTQIDNK